MTFITFENSYFHHVLKDIGLCICIAVSLGFADYTVVFEEENVAVVTPRGRPDSRRSLPHLERSLVVKKNRKNSINDINY